MPRCQFIGANPLASGLNGRRGMLYRRIEGLPLIATTKFAFSVACSLPVPEGLLKIARLAWPILVSAACKSILLRQVHSLVITAPQRNG
jgi:hypothetical protein